MTLQELRVNSYLYQNFSDDERNYLGIANEKLDVKKDEDNSKLMKFLNDWGCRQFKIEDHEKAKASLKRWYGLNEKKLPSHKQKLLQLPQTTIRSYADVFDELKESYACSTKTGKKTFGVVGAAKTLFALRKHAFPPWDNPIIQYFGFDKCGRGYVDYLLEVRNELLKLREYCQRNGIDFNNIPYILNRPHASMVKLIDEFYWMNYTRGCIPSTLIKYGKLPHNSQKPIH